MFHPLPAETVFESQQQSRKDTALLFTILFITYISLFCLAGIVLLFTVTDTKTAQSILKTSPYELAAAAILTGLLTAIIHFRKASSVTIGQILEQIGARSFDTKDDYHKIFSNLVKEAESASGVRPIQPVVLASGGCNAFSISDGKGGNVIGITEGLLTRLTRPELSAVIAHEAAHLANGDSRLSTLAGCITNAFNSLLRLSSKIRYSKTGRPFYGLGQAIIWVIAQVGSVVSHILQMSISRQREYLADSHAVQMCKDPVSMHRALQKISRQYRGSLELPDQFAPVFILNPSITALDEQNSFFSDLFSTHPPVEKRLQKLKTWAKTDLPPLKEEPSCQAPDVQSSSQTADAAPALPYLFNINGAWRGPYTQDQILSLPEIQPATWSAPVNSAQVSLSGDIPALFALFEKRLSGTVCKESCPNCKTRLIEMKYESAPVMKCSFCEGYLLRQGIIERIISRRDRFFTDKEIEHTKSSATAPPQSAHELASLTQIICPSCKTAMLRCFHSQLTKVVIDRCVNALCGCVWLDRGELEAIQILIEQFQSEPNT